MLNIDIILYVLMQGNIAEIHVSRETIYKTRISFKEIEEKLDDRFIKNARYETFLIPGIFRRLIYKTGNSKFSIASRSIGWRTTK